MPDITTPTILDTLASHLRRCAVLVDDAPSVDFLMQTARALDDRAEELREDARKQPPVARPVNPEKAP